MIAHLSEPAGALLAAAEPDVVDRAAGAVMNDPWWLVLIKAVAVFAFLVVITIFNIFAERRVIAMMQQRVGPNRTGPFGVLQGLADGIKLAFKEDVNPKSAGLLVYLLAPVLVTVPAILAFAVIPMGGQVSVFGVETRLQLTDTPVAVLYVLAVASVGIYGIVLAGWSSGSTYPLLGGLRSSAQMISYEIAMGLSFVAVFLYAGSMSTSEIVDRQASGWFAWLLPVSFLVYLVAMVGETNRAPFDLPEAEGELVAGFHTEYSSLKFALFLLAEYINMANVSALATTLFLGGWRAPFPAGWVHEQTGIDFNAGWWGVLWFLLKVFALLFCFVWLRGTLPRLRYDQFMQFGWKVLIPVSLAWILLVATVRTLNNQQVDVRTPLMVGAGVLIALLAVSWVVESVAGRRQEAAAQAGPEPFDPFAGGFPVPPLPGQQPVEEGRATLPAQLVPAGPAGSGTGATETGGGERREAGEDDRA